MRAEIGRGAGWMVLLRASDRMLAVLNTLVLARLLVPADFGLVAMAMSIIVIMELAASFGFDVALIQREAVDRRHYDTAWTLNIALYIGLGLVVAALAYPAAAFYREPRLAAVILVIAAGWSITGFSNPGVVDFRRYLQFGREFAMVASCRLIGVAITIAAAFAWRSYWALVLGSVAGRLVQVLASYLAHPYRPHFCLNATSELISFSRWLLLQNAVQAVLIRLPHFLIGRTLGPGPLGLYTIAYEIATVPATEVSAPVNRAALPGYSRLAGDAAAIKRTFLDVGALVLVIGLAVAVGLAAVAEPAVQVLLGDRWLPAAPAIEILAFSAAVVLATGNNGVVQVALGYPRLVTYQALLRTTVFGVLAFLLVRPLGLVGVALAEFCGACVGFIASVPPVFRLLGVTPTALLGTFWRPVLASAVMFTGVRAIAGLLAPQAGLPWTAAGLAACVLAGAGLYVLSLYLAWRLSGRPEGAECIMLRKLPLARVRQALLGTAR